MRQHFPEENFKINPAGKFTGQIQILTIQKYEKKLLFHLGMENS